MLKMAIANVTEASLSHILHANLFKFIWQSVKPGHPTQTLTSTKGNKNTLMDDASTYHLPGMANKVCVTADAVLSMHAV